jgi:cytochrome c
MKKKKRTKTKSEKTKTPKKQGSNLKTTTNYIFWLKDGIEKKWKLYKRDKEKMKEKKSMTKSKKIKKQKI